MSLQELLKEVKKGGSFYDTLSQSRCDFSKDELVQIIAELDWLLYLELGSAEATKEKEIEALENATE